MTQAKVLLCEDHRLFAEALAASLSRTDGFEVVGVATSVHEARELISSAAPTVVLADLGLPDGTGIDVVEIVRTSGAPVAVIVLSAATDEDEISRAIEAGANGFVHKDAPVAHLLDAIARVQAGERVLPPGYRVGSRRRNGHRDRRPVVSLTVRELEVLRMLVAGKGSMTIASVLGIKQNTVRTHIQSILTKMQVHSRLEAVAYAVREGLLGDRLDAIWDDDRARIAGSA